MSYLQRENSKYLIKDAKRLNKLFVNKFVRKDDKGKRRKTNRNNKRLFIYEIDILKKITTF